MDLARNLKEDTVWRLAPTAPRRTEADRTVGEAVQLMRRDRVGCLLVTDGGRLVGVFTERDLLARVLAAGRPWATPVAAVMTPDPVTVTMRDPIGRAVRRMEKGGYRHLPVVDDQQRPVGVLSVKRVVRYLAEHFPAIVYNLPPDPAAVPQEREGA